MPKLFESCGVLGFGRVPFTGNCDLTPDATVYVCDGKLGFGAKRSCRDFQSCEDGFELLDGLCVSKQRGTECTPSSPRPCSTHVTGDDGTCRMDACKPRFDASFCGTGTIAIDGECLVRKPGCTDVEANNYDGGANFNDGSYVEISNMNEN